MKENKKLRTVARLLAHHFETEDEPEICCCDVPYCGVLGCQHMWYYLLTRPQDEIAQMIKLHIKARGQADDLLTREEMEKWHKFQENLFAAHKGGTPWQTQP